MTMSIEEFKEIYKTSTGFYDEIRCFCVHIVHCRCRISDQILQ